MDKINEFIAEFMSMLPEGVEFDINNLGVLLSPQKFFAELIKSITLGDLSSVLFSLIASSVVIFISSAYETRLTPMVESGISIMFLIGSLDGLVSLGESVSSSLGNIADFFASLSPLIVAVSIFGGGKNLSAASAIQMSLTSSVVQLVSGEILVPAVSAMIILGIASTLGGKATPKILKSLKDIFTKALGFISVVSAALFSLQSVIASASDSASLRLAKFTAQSLAPSVGTVISSSMSTLASGVSYAKGIIGAGAVYAILAMMMSAMPKLILYRLVLGISENFADIMNAKAFSSAICGLRYAVDSLISVYFIFSSMFILQCILFIRSGVAI